MVRLPLPKLIALDLDETTLNRESQLSPGNRAALEAAVQRGCILVIASGRAFDTLPEEMLRFPGVQYAICGNGAAVYALPSRALLAHHTVPPEAVDQILTLSLGQNLTFEAFVAGCAYAQGDYIEDPTRYMCDPMTVHYVKASRRPVVNIRAFLSQHRAELDSLDLVVGDLEVKAHMTELLSEIPDVYITTSVPRLIEISHRDCGKHRGLEFLSNLLDIPQKSICAFGNADNDADMLSWAGCGIAVANSSPACLAAANHVTGHFLEDGVAQALRDYFDITP